MREVNRVVKVLLVKEDSVVTVPQAAVGGQASYELNRPPRRPSSPDP